MVARSGETKGEGSRQGARRHAVEHRLSDTTLAGTLEVWPDEPPRPPRTPVEAARLALIAAPGEVHYLAWKLSDVGRATRIASSFKRAKPSNLLSIATGSFDARAFFDPNERKWRIAVRYVVDKPASG